MYSLNIKHIIYAVLLSLSLFLGIFQYITIGNLKDENKLLAINLKSYAFALDSSKNTTRVYEFTVNQLKYFNDSINNKLIESKKKLKLKDKSIKTMQYLLTQTTQTDSIIVKDTIFKEKDFKLDTLISDKWYQLKLYLEYPNIIVVAPTFKSEKTIIVSDKKETIEPPKKYWIQRVFQKKQTVLIVDVTEQSPYTTVLTQRFIKIIK